MRRLREERTQQGRWIGCRVHAAHERYILLLGEISFSEKSALEVGGETDTPNERTPNSEFSFSPSRLKTLREPSDLQDCRTHQCLPTTASRRISTGRTGIRSTRTHLKGLNAIVRVPLISRSRTEVQIMRTASTVVCYHHYYYYYCQTISVYRANIILVLHNSKSKSCIVSFFWVSSVLGCATTNPSLLVGRADRRETGLCCCV